MESKLGKVDRLSRVMKDNVYIYESKWNKRVKENRSRCLKFTQPIIGKKREFIIDNIFGIRVPVRNQYNLSLGIDRYNGNAYTIIDETIIVSKVNNIHILNDVDRTVKSTEAYNNIVSFTMKDINESQKLIKGLTDVDWHTLNETINQKVLYDSNSPEDCGLSPQYRSTLYKWILEKRIPHIVLMLRTRLTYNDVLPKILDGEFADKHWRMLEMTAEVGTI